MMTSHKYHQPVLLNEAVEGLVTNPNGVYVDATFGSGGHSEAVLDHLQEGRLVGFDKDATALDHTIDDERFTLVNHDFIYMENFLRYFNLLPVDGILADLGVSSIQIDEPERGFAHRYDTDIDMRMDPDSRLSAYEVVNRYGKDRLTEIFREYGEIRKAPHLADAIIAARAEKPVKTTGQLAGIIREVLPGKHKEAKFLSMAFQAIRLEVNQEIERLKRLLHQAGKLLSVEGRLAVISYHSLEDRLVKRFFNTGNFEGVAKKDEKGNLLRPFEPVTRKAVKPPKEEMDSNPRARSARLRIAKKASEEPEQAKTDKD